MADYDSIGLVLAHVIDDVARTALNKCQFTLFISLYNIAEPHLFSSYVSDCVTAIKSFHFIVYGDYRYATDGVDKRTFAHLLNAGVPVKRITHGPIIRGKFNLFTENCTLSMRVINLIKKEARVHNPRKNLFQLNDYIGYVRDRIKKKEISLDDLRIATDNLLCIATHRPMNVNTILGEYIMKETDKEQLASRVHYLLRAISSMVSINGMFESKISKKYVSRVQNSTNSPTVDENGIVLCDTKVIPKERIAFTNHLGLKVCWPEYGTRKVLLPSS